MKYINQETCVIRFPEYIGCEPVARATWWNVLSHACEIETGGRLRGAKAWGDRRWQQTCAVTLAEVNSSAPLLTWDGDDLVIWNYPGSVERRLGGSDLGGAATSPAKAEAARLNGLKGGRPPSKNNPPENPAGNPPENPSSLGSENPITQKPKEGGRDRGIEGGREREIPLIFPKGETHGEITDGRKPTSLSVVITFFANLDAPSNVAEDFFDHYQANGWKQGGRSALVSWQSAASKWVRKWRTESVAPGKKSSGARSPETTPFNPAKPHAHTGGLPLAN